MFHFTFMLIRFSLTMSQKMKLCSVQRKISCIFKSVVVHHDGDSNKDTKRPRQTFSVEASDILINEFILQLEGFNCLATEKVDGTSVLIKPFNGKPWLWARHDRKFTKQAEKRLKKLESNVDNAATDESLNKNPIPYDENDFKPSPENWEPTECCLDPETGCLIPDANGHIMGWVPVAPDSRQYCWHLETVDLNQGLALLLEPDSEDRSYEGLKISIRRMETMIDGTYELIGTHINNNPYNLGSKKSPIHFLVRHGALRIQPPASVSRLEFIDWFNNSDAGTVEGIVWHCQDGSMYKLHRHHLKLRWPISNAKLTTVPVEVDRDLGKPFSKCTSRLSSLYQRDFANLLMMTRELDNPSA